MVKLCRAYGEQPAITGKPIVPSPPRAPTPGARLAVQWVSVSVTPRAVIVQLAESYPSPTENRVGPGEKVKLTVSRSGGTPAAASTRLTLPSTTAALPVPRFPPHPTTGIVFPGS